MRKYIFKKYESIIDPTEHYYALAGKAEDDSPVIKEIDGETYIEVTQDFKTANMFKLDNLRVIGEHEREY